jgi:hypothetical protein
MFFMPRYLQPIARYPPPNACFSPRFDKNCHLDLKC